MRLLNSTTFQLTDFPNYSGTPEYAIFSHTWLRPNEGTELLFEDLERFPPGLEINVPDQKVEGYRYMFPKAYEGLRKVWLCCQQALRHDINWAWVDTCCIDKRSTAELSEAINSMFRWYKSAKVCYVYLADLDFTMESRAFRHFKSCRWFERGWTLQELLAPSEVQFYDKDWKFFGNRGSLDSVISERTGIDRAILCGWRRLTDASVAERMSWASARETTRLEDIAYCLMGIFDVNMPLLYGEGDKAFMRLQEEIIRNSDDQSLLAWSLTQSGSSWHNVPCSLLADHPSNFANARNIVPLSDPDSSMPYTMTNRGLQIFLTLRPISQGGMVHDGVLFHALLGCRFRDQEEDQQLALRIKLRGNAPKRRQFYRVCPHEVDRVPQSTPVDSEEDIYIIKQGIDVPNNSFDVVWNVSPRFSLEVEPRHWYNSKRKLLTMPDDSRTDRAAIIVKARGNDGVGLWPQAFAIIVGFTEHYPACVCLPMNSAHDLTRLRKEAQFSTGSSHWSLADGTKIMTELVNGDQINRITINELFRMSSGPDLPILENNPTYVRGVVPRVSSIFPRHVFSSPQQYYGSDSD